MKSAPLALLFVPLLFVNVMFQGCVGESVTVRATPVWSATLPGHGVEYSKTTNVFPFYSKNVTAYADRVEESGTVLLVFSWSNVEPRVEAEAEEAPVEEAVEAEEAEEILEEAPAEAQEAEEVTPAEEESVEAAETAGPEKVETAEPEEAETAEPEDAPGEEPADLDVIELDEAVEIEIEIQEAPADVEEPEDVIEPEADVEVEVEIEIEEAPAETEEAVEIEETL